MSDKIIRAARWIFALPLACGVALLTHYLIRLLYVVFQGSKPDYAQNRFGSIFNDAIAHFMIGFVFVLVGMTTAPTKERYSCYAFTLLAAIAGGWGLVNCAIHRNWMLGIDFAAVIAGAVIGAIFLLNEKKLRRPSAGG